MFMPNSKLHAYKVVAKFLPHNKKFINQGQNTMLIPRLTTLHGVT
jgi:hypothetical protein